MVNLLSAPAPVINLPKPCFLRGVANPRGWLEERLGPLAYFEVEAEAAAVSTINCVRGGPNFRAIRLAGYICQSGNN